MVKALRREPGVSVEGPAGASLAGANRERNGKDESRRETTA